MRRPILLACWLALASTDAARAAEDDFPYTAYVTAADVYVRSGPGEDYYPVLQLGHGEPVEVYRHDPGGWCAIRPNDDCFSWVAAEYLKLVDEDLAVVVGDNVAARVGSLFSDTRDVIQVRLDQGEEVVVLGKRTLHQGSTATVWYRIAPPSGEFRWISGRYIDRERQDLKASATRRKGPWNNLLLAKQSNIQDEAYDDGGEQDRAAGDDEFSNEAYADPHGPAAARVHIPGVEDDSAYEHARNDRTWPYEPHQVPRSDVTYDDEPFHARAGGAEDVADPGWHRAGERGSAASMTAVSRRSPVDTLGLRATNAASRAAADNDLRAALAELDLALSSMVANDPSNWDFATLTKVCDELLAAARTSKDRGHVRLFADKLRDFQAIHERWLAVSDGAAMRRAPLAMPTPPVATWTASPSAPVATPASPAASVAPMIASANDTDAAMAEAAKLNRYDGVGRLAQVAAANQGDPYYALLDSQGRVRCYVTPSPGVNPRPYLGADVGVTGTLGFAPDQRTDHVTARRIERLEERLIR